MQFIDQQLYICEETQCKSYTVGQPSKDYVKNSQEERAEYQIQPGLGPGVFRP